MNEPELQLDFDYSGFSQRIREAMAPEKVTAFAQRVGLPQSTVSKMISGSGAKGPRLDIAAKIAEGLGTSMDWLVFGRGDGVAPGGDVLKVPRYGVQLAAGAGSWNEGRRKIEDVPLTRTFLQEQLGRSSAAGLTILESRGDSMMPTIADRALMVVDETVDRVFDDVFAFVLDGEARVKRFRRQTDGILLISDNESYPPELVTGPNLKKLQVVGQVLGVLQAV